MLTDLDMAAGRLLNFAEEEAAFQELARTRTNYCKPPPAADQLAGKRDALAAFATGWPWQPLDTQRCLQEDPPPVSWLVDAHIELGRGHVLTGIGGSSKTRVLKTIGVGVAVGRMPWAWTISRPGRAVLICTEDRPGEMHRHVRQIADSMRLTAAERTLVAARLVLFPLAGETVRLMTVTAEKIAIWTDLADKLLQLIGRLGDVVFVGLDPALGLTDGDEMSQAHQRALGKLLDDLAIRSGAAVMAVTHAAKASSTADELNSHMSRGGGALTDAVRSEHGLRTMTAAEARTFGVKDPEERKRHVQLVALKGNELPPASYSPVWLRRGDGGALFPADLEPPTNDAPGRTDIAALDALRDLCKTSTPKLRDWREECVRLGIIRDGMKDGGEKAMQRILHTLLAAGFVESGHGRGVYLPAVQTDE